MGSPVWISHRGFCQDHEENSAQAFRAACAIGFEHLETDLRTTADGHIVLAHDPTMERLTGTTHTIESSPRTLLERMSLRGGEKLLFFDQFLQEFAGLDWIFDIKPESALRTIDALLPWWEMPEYQDFFQHRVRFLFWDKAHQAHLLRSKPAARCMARMEQCRRAAVACVLGLPRWSSIEPGVTYALPVRYKGVELLRPAVLARYRQRSARVMGYLPATDAEARRALAAGVDEILTDGRKLA